MSSMLVLKILEGTNFYTISHYGSVSMSATNSYRKLLDACCVRIAGLSLNQVLRHMNF
jgi:hypothetical protein